MSAANWFSMLHLFRRLMTPVTWLSPSPTSAEDCSSLFGWFIGTTARSDSSGACVLALWLWAFANRSRSWSDRVAPEVSRFSCMLFLSVRGFLDYAGPTDHSRPNAASHFAFLPLGTESAPCSSVFRSSIARPTDTPDLRFDQHLDDVDRKIRGQDGFAAPFLYDSFIRYNMPVYPGAPRDTPVTTPGIAHESRRTLPGVQSSPQALLRWLAAAKRCPLREGFQLPPRSEYIRSGPCPFGEVRSHFVVLPGGPAEAPSGSRRQCPPSRSSAVYRICSRHLVPRSRIAPTEYQATPTPPIREYISVAGG